MLESEVDGMLVRGIIDRLDRDENGQLHVVDYKTGRAPRAQDESAKMAGVNAYAYLCQQVMGEIPVTVRLLHLKEPVVVTAPQTNAPPKHSQTRQKQFGQQ